MVRLTSNRKPKSLAPTIRLEYLFCFVKVVTLAHTFILKYRPALSHSFERHTPLDYISSIMQKHHFMTLNMYLPAGKIIWTYFGSETTHLAFMSPLPQGYFVSDEQWLEEKRTMPVEAPR